MKTLFKLILTQPLFNALVLLYTYVTFQDLGLAIIVLTIIVRIILYPLFYKGLRNQMLMQKIQPEMKRLQKELKHDKEKQATEMMALWKKHEINPFAGIFLLFIQLPIIFAIFHVFRVGLTPETMASNLYAFVSMPEAINNTFLGLIDLAQPSMVILVLAVILSYIQSRMALPKIEPGKELSKTEKTSRRMSYIVPVIIGIFLLNLSAAIGLYIITTTIFSIFQQYSINKKLKYVGLKPETENNG
ncbi:MAG: YidC/Oxa1 family membrane protein insertase [Candidatus Harrisonbacteria bacterium]|nr:YidC/Oxa1 family membrane protein insertase [Candidatus Harrisonbacteria bacterium]